MNQTTPDDFCPTCGLCYNVRYRCLLSHKECANGHAWHTCPAHQVVVSGPSNHSDTSECTCKR